jgi:hypothetical protein
LPFAHGIFLPVPLRGFFEQPDIIDRQPHLAGNFLIIPGQRIACFLAIEMVPIFCPRNMIGYDGLSSSVILAPHKPRGV